MMFVSVSDDFTNLRHKQDAKLLFEPECTILGYQSCEASILVHWTQMMFASVSELFTNFRHVKGAKLVFRDRMHYFGVPKFLSIHSSPMYQCTQNDVWKCFGAFRKPSAGKRRKTRVSGPNAIFQGTKL
jgi:hypothetical protein